MSDTTPHDGTTRPEADAAPANSAPASSAPASSAPASSEPARSEPALTYPPADAPRASAPAHEAPTTGDTAGLTDADETAKRHDAALAAATDRANSGDLPGEYTESETPDTASHTASHVIHARENDATAASVAPSTTAASTAVLAPVATNTPVTPVTQSPEPTRATPATQTPIYVQAPTPPKDRSNRGGGILIALVATLVYAVIYAAAVFTIVGLSSSTITETTRVFTEFTVRPVFYVPVIFFFLAFALLVSLVNRAGWWSYVLFGFLVAVVVYLAYVGSVLLTVQAWTLSSSEIASVLSQQWFAPFAIAAAVIAREVPIWFGAWISRRGRGVTSRNAAARTEYERVLAEGPQVARAN